MSVRKIAVYGGRGGLGSYFIQHLKNLKYWVANIDLQKNDEAHFNVIIPDDISWLEQERHVVKEMDSVLQTDKLDAVLCLVDELAQGYVLRNMTNQTELMWKQSVWSSTIAATLACKYLQPKGILVLTGAKSALSGTPGKIGYGMAKAAVHHLTKSLGSSKSGLPKNSSVVAILPDILDTDLNTQLSLPNTATSTWTPLRFVFDEVEKWINGVDRPPNGSLVAITTADHVSKTTLIQEH